MAAHDRMRRTLTDGGHRFLHFSGWKMRTDIVE